MKLTDIKNSLNEISAIGGLKQVVKGNTDRVEGIKLSKEMAQAMIDWFNSSPYGRKYPKAAKARLHISLGIMSVMGLDRYAKHKGAKEELKYIKDLSKAMRDNVNEAKGKFKKDDLVYNKRTKTVGIVRMGDDKYGEVKTDADGNVNVDELEKYNPIKNKHQSNAKVAPSTEKEVNKRGLFNPFKNESKEDCGCGCGGVTEGGCGDSKLEEEQVAVATRDSSGNITTRIKEGMFGAIDQIRQDSKDVRDFVKNVFKDNEFKKMSNDKDFIKYLKSIYEGVDEGGMPQNFHQGRTSDYHTALRGKNRDYSGGTNFKKKNHGQPDVEEDDEDQETNHLSNQQLHVKAKLKVAESGKKKSEKNYKDWKNTNEGFDKVEHLSLLNKALRAIPGSNKQKDIIRQLNVIRKTGGMRPLKELSIVEYGQRLDLSFIEDEEAKLDGTYPSTDAIDRDIDESLKDMVGDTYTFSIGSGDEKKITPNTKEYVIEKIAETIKHNLYDWDFSLNGIDGSQAKEYSKIFDNDVLKPLLRNIDKTLKTYFKIDSKNKKISWKLSFRDNDKIIDAFFKKNKKISSDIRDSYFSQNEAVINEKQFKGLDGIDDKTPLTKISDTQKLKIIQSTGNIISFKVPKGSDRNFWQVISKGKIKKQKDLSNNVVYILPGKMIGSPKFKSIKDLIKGVDWVSVEKARRFNESVSEVAERDYKDEYKKFQSSTKSKKYRAELNKYNRDKGTYGNGDGKDASHKGGKIVGFESEKKNRGRAEKSRLKKK